MNSSVHEYVHHCQTTKFCANEMISQYKLSLRVKAKCLVIVRRPPVARHTNHLNNTLIGAINTH